MNKEKKERIKALEKQIADIKTENEAVYTLDHDGDVFKNGNFMYNSDIVKELNDYHSKSKRKWIKWNGGEQPVGDKAYVKIKFRNKNKERGEAGQWHGWNHENFEGGHWDIIAYMVID